MLGEPSIRTRDDLVREQVVYPPLGSRHAGELPVRVGVTGSGSALVVLAWSPAALAGERAAGVRLFARLGIGAGLRIANTLPGALATPGALLLGDVVEEMGALDVPLGAIESPAAAGPAWALVDRVEPHALVLDAASGAQLLAAAPARPRPWLRGIVWLCDGSGTRAAEVPAQVGFTGWERSWLAVPEVSSFAGQSCAGGSLHLDDALGAEVLDGELVLRARQDAACRYRTGIRTEAGACPCGMAGVAVRAGVG